MAEREVSIVLPKDANPQKTLEAVRTSIETGGHRTEFAITLGDLTQADVDAIVCPANPGFEYAGFGGVQVAIERRAGMATFDEAEGKARQLIEAGQGVQSPDGRMVGVPTGFAAATTAGKLSRIKSIIHVNNMRVEKDPPCDEDVVRTCTANVLLEADRLGLKSVATPALGTGIWGVSLPESIRGTIRGLKDYIEVAENPGIEKLVLVIYAQATLPNAREIQGLLLNDVLPGLQSK